jgi:hypothetical protein
MSTAVVIPVVTSLVGNLIANLLTPIQNKNKLDPLALRATAEYGSPISQAYGHVRIDGLSMFWGQNLIQTVNGGGGKGFGARTRDYKYYMTCAYMIGGEISDLRCVWCNGVQVYSKETVQKKSANFVRHSEVFLGTLNQPISSVISSVEGNAIPAFRGRSYITFNRYPLSDFNGSGFPKVDVLVYGKGGVNPTIRSIIQDIFTSAGFDTNKLDLSDVPAGQQIEGLLFQRTGETYADYLNEICRLFFLTHREENGVFKLLQKTRPSVSLNLALNNLGARNTPGKSPDLFQEKIQHKREMPSEVQISFRNLGDNYSQWVVTASDPLAKSKNPLSIQTRAWANPTFMEGLANRIIGEVASQRNTFSGISLLPCWYTKLHLGDVIGLNIGSRVVQLQITKKLLSADYLCQIEGNQYLSPITCVVKNFHVWIAVRNLSWVFITTGSKLGTFPPGGLVYYTRTTQPFVGHADNLQVMQQGVQRGDGVYSQVFGPVATYSESPLAFPEVATLPEFQGSAPVPVFSTSCFIGDPTIYIDYPDAELTAIPQGSWGSASPIFDWDQAVVVATTQTSETAPGANQSNTIPYDPRNDNNYYAVSQVASNYTPQVAKPYSRVSSYTEGILHVLDIPILKNSDNPLGIYFAVESVSNFSTGTVFISTDNGLTFNESITVKGASAVGIVYSSPMQAGPTGIIDPYTKIDIYAPNSIFESVTDAAFLAGENLILIGQEIIAFRDVLVKPNNVYQISYLIRGVKGTERLTGTHVVGESAILLNNVTQLATKQGDIGKNVEFKIVPYDQTETDITDIVTINYKAQSATPYNVTGVKQTKASNGDITLSWYRRTYQNGGLLDYVDIGFASGEISAFKIEVWVIYVQNQTNSVLVNTYYVSNVNSFIYTQAQQSVDLNNSVANKFFRIYQQSSITGYGNYTEVQITNV